MLYFDVALGLTLILSDVRDHLIQDYDFNSTYIINKPASHGH